MGLDLEYAEGQTPLDEDERDGLHLPMVATRGELDEFEQQNIEKAVQWTLGRSFKPELIFTERFIRMVHERMYGEVWGWAGQFRSTDKNIGVDKFEIPVELKKLLDDSLYLHAHKVVPADELAMQFKHRLVSIHCFANGNGRHSRLMADIIIEKIFKLPVFSWGAKKYPNVMELRAAYIKALRSADKGDFAELLEFCRS